MRAGPIPLAKTIKSTAVSGPHTMFFGHGTLARPDAPVRDAVRTAPPGGPLAPHKAQGPGIQPPRQMQRLHATGSGISPLTVAIQSARRSMPDLTSRGPEPGPPGARASSWPSPFPGHRLPRHTNDGRRIPGCGAVTGCMAYFHNHVKNKIGTYALDRCPGPLDRSQAGPGSAAAFRARPLPA